MGSVVYECMLSLYFVMVVVYSKREDAIQKRIEPVFHATSILLPLGARIFLLVTNNCNDAGNICCIAASPPNCGDPDAEVECNRGENAKRYVWYFQTISLILIGRIVVGCIISLVNSVGKQLKKIKKYRVQSFIDKVENKS